MHIDTIAVLNLAALLASNCVEPPVKASVLGDVGAITVATSLSLTQIKALSERVGGVRAHEPYGFYVSKVAYEIAVQIGNGRHDICAGPVDIQVTVSLEGRHIEVGEELRQNACLFTAVASHYQRHAAADATVFRNYIPVVVSALDKAPLSMLVGIGGNSDGSNQKIARAVQDIIDPILHDMQAAQAVAVDAVDTPDEIEQLRPECRSKT